MRRLAILLCLTIGLAGVAYFVAPPRASKDEARKLRQHVGQHRFHDESLFQVLRSVASSLTDPVAFDVCGDLVTETVSVSTTPEMNLEEFLEDVGSKLKVKVRLFRGHHNELLLPTLGCRGGNGRYLRITAEERHF